MKSLSPSLGVPSRRARIGLCPGAQSFGTILCLCCDRITFLFLSKSLLRWPGLACAIMCVGMRPILYSKYSISSFSSQAGKSDRPMTISTRIQPMDQMSNWESYGKPMISSGGFQFRLPTLVKPDFTSYSSHDTPKSMILIYSCVSSVNSMFSGLRSRWMTLILARWSSACSIWVAMLLNLLASCNHVW